MLRRTILLVILLLPFPASAAEPWPICGSSPRITCVVDGDTFWLNREKIRIENIDTPEIQQAECAAELELAFAATVRLAELLGTGTIELARNGEDRYDRTLATVRVEGIDVGAVLIAEQLAAAWEGRQAEWC